MEETPKDPINAPHADPPVGHGATPVDTTPVVTNQQKANKLRVRIGEINNQLASLTVERQNLNSEIMQLELSN